MFAFQWQRVSALACSFAFAVSTAQPCDAPRDLHVAHVGFPLGDDSLDVRGLLGSHQELAMREWSQSKPHPHWGADAAGRLRGVHAEDLIYEPERLKCLLVRSPNLRVLAIVQEPALWLTQMHFSAPPRGPSVRNMLQDNAALTIRGRELNTSAGKQAMHLLRGARVAGSSIQWLVLDVDSLHENPFDVVSALARFLGVTRPFPWTAAGPIVFGPRLQKLRTTPEEAADLCGLSDIGIARELLDFYQVERRALLAMVLSTRGAGVASCKLRAPLAGCSDAAGIKAPSLAADADCLIAARPWTCANYEAGVNWRYVQSLLAMDNWRFGWQGRKAWLKEIRFMRAMLIESNDILPPHTPDVLAVHVECPLGALAIRALTVLQATTVSSDDTGDLENQIIDLGHWMQLSLTKLSLAHIEMTPWADVVSLMSTIVTRVHELGLGPQQMRCSPGECIGNWNVSAKGDASEFWHFLARSVKLSSDRSAACVVVCPSWSTLELLRGSTTSVGLEPAPLDELIAPTAEWLLFARPDAACLRPAKLGGNADPHLSDMGAYEVCLEDASGPLLDSSCVVFALGVSNDGHQGWEAQVARRGPCRVLGVDMRDVRPKGSPHHLFPADTAAGSAPAPGPRFLQAVLAGTDDSGASPPRFTLSSLLREMSAGRRVDVLKFSLGDSTDPAGLVTAVVAELATIEASGARQLIFDVIMVAATARKILRLFAALEELRGRGWALMARVLNPQWHPAYMLLDSVQARVPVPGNNRQFPWPQDPNESGERNLCAVNLSFLRHVLP